MNEQTIFLETSDFLIAREVTEGGETFLVKTLRTNFADPSAPQRLKNEYAISKKLTGPGFRGAVDFRTNENRTVLTLRYVEGVPLSEATASGPVDIPTFLSIAERLAAALDVMHGKGIIHRDIADSNILIDERGVVTLIDFDHAVDLDEMGVSSLSSSRLLGQLKYLSPEQTGRLNQSVDHRTDLYSLGVVFFRLLTGALPFSGSDPMAWIHAHIALQPPKVEELNRAVPPLLGNIVATLLAKAPDDRYHSAAGLLHDLRRFRDQWPVDGDGVTFPLAERDVSARIVFPRDHDGNEQEYAALRRRRDEALSGKAGIVLVSSSPGMGKSTLISRLRNDMAEGTGAFFSVVSSPTTMANPFDTFGKMIDQWAERLLASDPKTLEVTRHRLRQELGPYALHLVRLAPHLATLLEADATLAPPDYVDMAGIMEVACSRALVTLCAMEGGAVLFLDDAHYESPVSLAMLCRVISGLPDGACLLILSHRSDSERNVEETVEQSATVPVERIAVRGMSVEKARSLLARTLGQTPEEVAVAADALRDKTFGNPLAFRNAVMDLAESGGFTFDPAARTWSYDLARIESYPLADHVAEMIKTHWGGVEADVRSVLEMAAFGPTRFGAASLASILGVDEEETLKHLVRAARQRLIVAAEGAYTFSHDTIRTTIRDDVSPQRRQEINRILADDAQGALSDDELIADPERLYRVVEYLNQAIDTLTTSDEKGRLVRLNVAAADRLKRASEYGIAYELLVTAEKGLPSTWWDERRDEAFATAILGLSLSYLLGKDDEAERRATQLLALDLATDEIARVRIAQLIHLTYRAKWTEAIAVGRLGLALYDADLPSDDTGDWTGARLQEIEAFLSTTTIPDLIDLPVATDPDNEMVMTLLVNLVSPTYIAAQELVGPLVVSMVGRSFHYGNGPISAYAYDAIGMIYGSFMGNYERGDQFGALAVALNKKQEDLRWRSQILLTFGANISHWRHPLEESVPLLEEGYRVGVATGDLLWGGYNLGAQSLARFSHGHPLEEISGKLDQDIPILAQMKNPVTPIMRVMRQAAEALLGRTESPTSLSANGFVEEEVEKSVREMGHSHALHNLYVVKSLLHYLNGDYRVAYDYVQKAHTYAGSGAGLFFIGEIRFLQGLIATALLDDEEETERRDEYRQAAEEARTMIGNWANEAPSNYGHKKRILEAMWEAHQGDPLEAVALYEQAIAQARSRGFAQDEAIACELAGKLWLKRNVRNLAHHYFRMAHAAYLVWGAVPHAQRMAEERRFVTSQTVSLEGEFSTSSTGSTTSSSVLDRVSLAKASQALSSEIDIDALLGRLLQILAENSGARRCVLARSPYGSWELKDGQIGPCDPLPENLLNYVERTGETVILDEQIVEYRFRSDSYLALRRPKSALGVPLVRRNEVVGVVYLENDVVAGVFDHDRVETVQLLVAQAAISLENAALYRELNGIRRAVEGADDSIAITDREGRVTYVNAAFETLTGYRAEEALGRPLAMIRATDGKKPAAIGADENGGGEALGATVVNRKKSGEPYSVAAKISPIYDSAGNLEGYVSVERDVTKERMISQARDYFLSVTGHELRTPLTQLELVKLLLEEGGGSPEAGADQPSEPNPKEILDGAIGGFHRIVTASMVFTDVLLSGERWRFFPVRIKEFLMRMVTDERTNSLQHGRTVSIVADFDDLPDDCETRGAADLLQQAAHELFSNAIKYTPDQGKIGVNATCDDEKIRIVITDTGIGIPRDQIAYVFDPLFSLEKPAHHSTSQYRFKGGGIGMGLAVARFIVQGHGGTIALESDEQKGGATVTITLPVASS